MGLVLNWTSPEPPAGKWVSDRRLWLDANGAVVEDGDPAAAFLLVTKGGTLPLNVAKSHGLVTEPEPEGDAVKTEAPETKAVKGPPENKAMAPKETKREGPKQHFTSLDPHADKGEG